MRHPPRIVLALMGLVLALPAGASATHGDDIADARPLAIGAPDTIVGYEADSAISAEAYTDQTGEGEQRALGCGGSDIGLDGSAWWRVTQGKRRLSATVTGALGKVWALHATGALGNVDWCQFNTGTGAATAQFPKTYAEDTTLHIRAGACYRISSNQYCGASGGALTMRVTSAPPGNDARDSAAEVAVAPQQKFDNHGATEESENLTCTSNGKTAQYRSTVWFKYTPAKFGTATFSASHVHTDHLDTVLAVYRGGETQYAECFDNPNTSDGSSTVTMPVTAGQPLFVQVGSYATDDPVAAQGSFLYEVKFNTTDGDGDGDPDGADCAPDNAGIRHGATDVPHNNVDEDCSGADDKDEDDDGHAASFAGGDDCDDKNKLRFTGAPEVANNGIDENCDLRDAAARLPTQVQVSLRSDRFRNGRIFARLYVRGLRKGYRVEVRCRRSSSCPKTFKRKIGKGRQVAIDSFRRRLFRRRTVIEIFVTVPGNVIGFYKSYTVVAATKNPKQRTCDLDPKAPRKPVRC